MVLGYRQVLQDYKSIFSAIDSLAIFPLRNTVILMTKVLFDY
jgi:hypothetical protein